MQPVPARSARLTVDMILHVAGSKYARNRRRRRVSATAALGDDVATLHFELTDKELSIRFVADGDEYTHQRDDFRRSALYILDAHAGYPARVAEDFIERRVPFDRHLSGLFLFEQFVLQDFFTAELVANGGPR